MDKLAKALEKARGERDSVLGNGAPYARMAGETRRPVSDDYQFHEAPIVSVENTVKVSDAALENNRIVAHRPRSEEADTFRILRTQVLQTMTQNGMKTLGVSSPNYGDGKTTIALNLALSIAMDLKQTVLLVDLDLRKPNVMDYLGLQTTIGLTDYFTRNVPIADCLVRPSFDRLSILPAGRVLENSSEVLGSPKIAALAEELRTRYADRLIIYDLPPVLAQDDPLVFLPHVDGLLLVVNEGRTRTHDLKTCMRALTNATVIGTVLNNSQVVCRPRRAAARKPEFFNRVK
ncbi:MAG: CpsD/CapB family tyrosine-protein kinase [Rickettsiales bacterium]